MRDGELFNSASVIKIVVSFLGNAITGNYGEAEDRIGRLAQQLVEYFDK